MTSSIKLFVLALFFILYSLFTTEVSAHVLETSGPIGAVVHIDPDDDPIAGESSNFFFEFKDKENKFSSEKCKCEIIVYQKGQELFRQNLFEENLPSLTNASATYTFPGKGVYTISIKGEPIDGEKFTPFILSYDVRVTREKELNNNISSYDWMKSNRIPAVIGILILAILAYRILNKQT